MIMKAVVTLLSLSLMVAVAASADSYATTWDNINLDDILNNNRLLSAYVNCLLDRGKCTADAAALKRKFGLYYSD
jgi:hypothetical protein